MEIQVLPAGIFDSNTYILSEQGECAVIDCGADPERILKTVADNKLKVRYIILTHGHADHIFHVGTLKNATGATLCIHQQEQLLYSDSQKNGFETFGFSNQTELPDPDRLLKHGDKLPLGNSSLEIIHTPGHSPGSISVLAGNMLFSGDTLFARSVGRTDLYGGSGKSLTDSVRNRLFVLDGDTVVYPGHGPSTTIGFERENNPYV